MNSLNREILRLALPSILANITVPIVGMVDIAMAGHLHGDGLMGAAAFIGGITVGSMLFDLLYWNFAFLRVGTGGLTAQAYGRGELKQCARLLTRALLLAWGIAAVLLLIQWPFTKLAFMIVQCSPEVKELALKYFFIRIWAAPATLGLMAFRGWFIGMQDSVSSMMTDLVVNVVNIIASVVLSVGFAGLIPGGLSDAASSAGHLLGGASGLIAEASSGGVSDWISGVASSAGHLLGGASGLIAEAASGGFPDGLQAGLGSSYAAGSTGGFWGSVLGWRGLGFSGIAWGTVVAQYTGLLYACTKTLVRYAKSVFAGLRLRDIAASFRGSEMRRFMSMNGDIFIRSICFTAIYIGVTTISARYGDLMLAATSIMMKLLMIFSFFTDGFAYAGEALTGRYIGAGDERMTRRSVKYVFAWSMSIVLFFVAGYWFGGTGLVRMMTSDTEVMEACRQFLPWLVLMPLIGCPAFTWDGIYLGATASKGVRNAMIAAALAFFGVWAAGIGVYGHGAAMRTGMSMAALASSDAGYQAAAIHILMAAYFAHLAARAIVLTLQYRREVLARWFSPDSV